MVVSSSSYRWCGDTREETEVRARYVHDHHHHLRRLIVFTTRTRRMLVIRTKVNNKYIRPKYGLGIFSKYTPVVRNTERGSVKKNAGKITLERALAKADGDKEGGKHSSSFSSGIGDKRKRANEKRVLVKKKTTSNDINNNDNNNVEAPRPPSRKNVAKVVKKRSKTDWGDSKLNDLLENS